MNDLSRRSSTMTKRPGRRRWRWLGCLVLGGVATLAFAPVDFVPALVVAISGLLLLTRDVGRARTAFWLGWWFGLGHFTSGLYWIANAFTIDERFIPLIPFAALGLPTVVAIYTGLVMAALTLLGLSGVGRVLGFAVLWAGFEWLRGVLFTGFPWNPVASVWSEIATVNQALALIGPWGLGLLTVAVAGLPSAWTARHGKAAVAAGIALVLAGWGYGAWRLSAADSAAVPGVRLRLVQASVPQNLKWEPAQRVSTLVKHLTLTRQTAAVPPTLVIWPETAVPFIVEWEREVVAAIAEAAPEKGAVVTGTIRIHEGSDRSRAITNGLVAVDRAGQVIGGYDKVHLVPFGEYVPLRPLIGWLPMPSGENDLVPGPGLQSLALPGAPPASPLICYEVIFPGAVMPAGERPHWLLNLTNDAWYGVSAGPYQHFAMARMRTVEEGMPLVRAAQNGISAVVDAYGRVTARLGLNEIGVLDADLPRTLPPTRYARWRDWPALALGVALLLLAFRLGHPRRSFSG
jgi:apolipoprotein N-acyltransferase